MANISVPTILPGPGAKPPLHTLFGAAVDLLSMDGDDSATDAADIARWEGGFLFVGDGCGDLTIVVPCTDDEFPTPTSPPDAVEFTPYEVVMGIECGTVALKAIDFQGRVTRRIDSATPAAVEAEFWRGDKAQEHALPNPYLADATTYTDVTPGGSGASPLVYGFAILQRALRECLNGPGVLHVTSNTLTLLEASRVISRTASEDVIRFYDSFGNRVVAGVGYDGSDDAGAFDVSFDTAWAYATGPVGVALGSIELLDQDYSAIDPQTNLVTVYGKRTAAAVFDPTCCHLAINLDLCATTCS